MPTHKWGDDWPHWEDLCDAEAECERLARRYRLPVHQIKEKWGELRFYCHLGYTSLHDMTHPGYHFNRYPKWLWWLNCMVFTCHSFPWRWLVYWPTMQLHRRLYRHLYKKLVAKWPHITEEIVSAADFPELLDGIGDKHG